MKELTDEFKLSARSTAHVFVLLGRLVDNLKADRRVRFQGKKPTRAAVVNAALLYLETLPEGQREQAVALGLRRLEEVLAEGEAPAVAPAPAPALAPATAAAKRAGPKRPALIVEDVSPGVAAEKSAGRRKKRG